MKHQKRKQSHLLDDSESKRKKITGSSEAEITTHEAALYDRQIRVWGLKGQKSLRNSKILICGLNGLTNEVLKNLALAGVGSIAILDDSEVENANELEGQFLIRPKDIGKKKTDAVLPKIQDMNPRVEFDTFNCSLRDKSASFYGNFDLICLSHANLDDIIWLNEICRSNDTKFYCADVFGDLGWLFCDVGIHKYQTESGGEVKVDEDSWISFNQNLLSSKFWKNKSKRKLKREASPLYFVMRIYLEFEKKHGRRPTKTDLDEVYKMRNELLLKSCGIGTWILEDDAVEHYITNSVHKPMESATCSIVGGVLSQDIIRSITAKGKPLENMFFFDGGNFTGLVHDSAE